MNMVIEKVVIKLTQVGEDSFGEQSYPKRQFHGDHGGAPKPVDTDWPDCDR